MEDEGKPAPKKGAATSPKKNGEPDVPADFNVLMKEASKLKTKFQAATSTYVQLQQLQLQQLPVPAHHRSVWRS